MAKSKLVRSRVIDNAVSRAASLVAIEPPLELGGSLSLPGYQEKIDDARSRQAVYNGLLSEADKARVEFLAAEKALALHYTRMLAAVAAQYGKESSVYAAAGGTMIQHRKRSTRKTAQGGEKLPSAV